MCWVCAATAIFLSLQEATSPDFTLMRGKRVHKGSIHSNQRETIRLGVYMHEYFPIERVIIGLQRSSRSDWKLIQSRTNLFSLDPLFRMIFSPFGNIILVICEILGFM